MGRPQLPFRPQFIETIRTDAPLKACAGRVGISIACATKWARDCGFKRMYVTDEERRAVMLLRRLDDAREGRAA